MKFLILFITLVLQHYRGINRSTTTSRSFSKWFYLFQGRPWLQKLGRTGRYILIVFIPSIVIGGCFIIIEDQLLGLPAIILEVALLLYVLSHADFERHVTQYRKDLENGDVQGAYRCAEQYLSIPEIELSDELAKMHDQVCHTILHRWFEFFFLMIFWFLVLGVPGVLLAWFSLQYSQLVHCEEKAWRPMHWLSWIPARLLGLTFALTGNFVQGVVIWKQTLWKGRAPADIVLYKVALASLSGKNDKESCMDAMTNAEANTKVACDQMLELQMLHRRSAIVWLVIIALITIVGGTLF
ncbi:MAG: regulatory signaling modulator protein AmpE [Oleispira antarctica]|nr:regulatory signaling modulator protein AmpE [Oleispira antarctica]MBQ0791634.1 regulatory signaling modulator protein AmpE [Oleispira antarctica]